MKFKDFIAIRKNLKGITTKNLLMLYWFLTEELEKRGIKIKVLEALKGV